MSKVYMYVVARDFGFAPNPFHGVCTLATCKPDIRSVAKEGDWVIGMGSPDHGAVGKCVFAMQVEGATTFEGYWTNPEYRVKRPVRNGSIKTMMGDNIYHRDLPTSDWQQVDSHHSRPDGTPDLINVATDTRINRVLLSRNFLYFGRNAPAVPQAMLDDMGYQNVRRHRTFDAATCVPLLDWLTGTFGSDFGLISGDPFDFDKSNARYSGEQGRVLT